MVKKYMPIGKGRQSQIYYLHQICCLPLTFLLSAQLSGFLSCSSSHLDSPSTGTSGCLATTYNLQYITPEYTV